MPRLFVVGNASYKRSGTFVESAVSPAMPAVVLTVAGSGGTMLDCRHEQASRRGGCAARRASCFGTAPRMSCGIFKLAGPGARAAEFVCRQHRSSKLRSLRRVARVAAFSD